MTYRALDLFCKAGGVSVGLQRAGFEVTGVDINPQPHYRGGTFVQADALTFDLSGYHLVWASPPCQKFSALARLHPDAVHPDLIAPVRTRLQASGAGAWVIENVPGAPLLTPFLLCGSMFGLGVQRHRLFEASFPTLTPCCNHGVWSWGRPTSQSNKRRGRVRSRVVAVYGGGIGKEEDKRAAMGIDWMTRQELNQAIPPAFSEWIGTQAIRFLDSQKPAV